MLSIAFAGLRDKNKMTIYSKVYVPSCTSLYDKPSTISVERVSLSAIELN